MIIRLRTKQLNQAKPEQIGHFLHLDLVKRGLKFYDRQNLKNCLLNAKNFSKKNKLIITLDDKWPEFYKNSERIKIKPLFSKNLEDFYVINIVLQCSENIFTERLYFKSCYYIVFKITLNSTNTLTAYERLADSRPLEITLVSV